MLYFTGLLFLFGIPKPTRCSPLRSARTAVGVQAAGRRAAGGGLLWPGLALPALEVRGRCRRRRRITDGGVLMEGV